VQVQVPGAPRAALLISPEHEPLWVTGRAAGADSLYTVPRVDIYAVLLLGASRQVLQPSHDAQMAFGGWRLDAVEAPPRQVVTGWQPWSEGFLLDEAVSHGGRCSIRCENAGATDLRGAVQSLDFTAAQKTNYTVTAWSRAENVSGPAHPDYSVYVDATCSDGTVYNGHATPFATGTHDWQQVTLQLTPPAPLRSLKLHLLFRKKTGRVWFDDVRMQATPAP
ncbi:MAG: carbohydrate binding domain-containing protein, partial [Armatimonadetes bacterium]|nr:carbohydrate binding domain-containing protein [Armatimonadota bacterium]